MTRYFEIAGELVEIADVFTSAEFRDFSHHVLKPMLVAGVDAYSTSQSSLSTGKDSLAEHWIKVVSLPIRTLGPEIGLDALTGPKKLGPMTPYIWASKALGVYAKTVEMNYDYFVKGESHDW